MLCYSVQSVHIIIWWCFHLDCSQSSIFCKIVEKERFALQAAILHECQNYLGGGGRFGGFFSRPIPPARAIIPNARPLGTCEKQGGRH